ncbi:elongation factor P--(R)-beta-lysine ligase [Glaciecola sp. KUL10]|uniref:elongation factor P--(R)-beta-lysine ligase n=1 Tax=Glaciecola sp. (strain KUL10) TaxID=2161813 RepID=UPI000D787098|nr:elongation factor P--(R)-beta-lysine ligase [Glaciecola sp. KUL10]GBL05182.1 lysyl-tRNA synthetase [Glaciecola sp. KUL10]
MQINWRPTASINTLRERAQLLKTIRYFFDVRNVLEVETPILARSTVTDVHLEAMSTIHTNPMDNKQSKLWMQTSPEFAMKRLLCAGSGCIYQICKSIRDDELGKKHNPEFTMLEWYRVGFDMQSLIDEVDLLLRETIGTSAMRQMTYQQAFVEYLGIDPLSLSIDTLVHECIKHGFENIVESVNLENNQQTDVDMMLQLLFSHCIEPRLVGDSPVSISHFPKSQAALAKLCPMLPDTALRFEVYYKGIELANGYEELQDAQIQKQRMEEDNRIRNAIGREKKPIDDLFLDALMIGLPKCSGVALGVDRLLMLKLGFTDIRKVISFSIENA